MVGSLRRDEGRKSDYKKGIDADVGRRRRDDTRLQLRKNKREEGLAKRRAVGLSSHSSESGAPSSLENGAPNPSTKKTYTIADIPTLLAGLQNQSAGAESLLEFVRGFRRMLSIEKNPPVREILDAGALPLLMQLLQRNDSHDLQFEAAWALTNVASTDYTATIVDVGAVGHLVALLRSPSPDVREQSAWCLGNVAGDSPNLRDYVLRAGAMEPLLQNIVQPANDTLLNNAVWALSNFCRGKPQPEIQLVAPAIPHLARLLAGGNPNVMMDACWALSYLSDGDDERIQAVIDSGVTEKLVSLLQDESARFVTPALRSLGNFVSGNDLQTQSVVNAGVLDHVEHLLANPKKNVRKETCWLLSNIAAGTADQIAALLRLPKEMSIVVSAVSNETWEVRKEATWVIGNIFTGGNEFQVCCMVELGGIEAICSVLDVNDAKITMVALDAIESILTVGESLGKAYKSFIDEAQGIDKIENLQEHEHVKIYEKAVDIIERFFGTEDDGDDENLAPAVGDDTFSFGLPQKSADGSGDAHQQQQPMNTFNFGTSSDNFSF